LPLAFAEAGDSVVVTFPDLEPARVAAGHVLCSLVQPQQNPQTPGGGAAAGAAVEEVAVPVARRFEARLTTFAGALKVPLIRGSQVQLHLAHAEVAANVSKLVALLDSHGDVRKVADPRERYTPRHTPRHTPRGDHHTPWHV